MSVEVLPLGNACNIACRYCYEEPMRETGNVNPVKKYNIDAMLAGLRREITEGGQDHFVVFGGEPLLVPLEDLKKLWEYGLTFGRQSNCIQSNGSLITPEHMKAFREYKVHVGFSIDGPGKLNGLRTAHVWSKTDEFTKKSIDNFVACLKDPDISASLILTLARTNAGPENLPILVEWFKELIEYGLYDVNLHFLEIDTPGLEKEILTDQELADAVMAIGELMESGKFKVHPLATMSKLLLGDDRFANCTWHPCDPYTTSAVQGVMGDGSRGNCGRAAKEGINWEKAQQPSYIRQQILWNTPYEDGGCKDCRFFYACKGNCPGEGIDGDWRNRTDKCGSLLIMFRELEKRLVKMGLTPISLDSNRRNMIVQKQLDAWGKGDRILIADC